MVNISRFNKLTSNVRAANAKNSTLSKGLRFLKPFCTFDVLKKDAYKEDYLEIRLIGPILIYTTHICEIMTKKGKIALPIPCGNVDSVTGDHISDDCPYCKADIKTTTKYYVNAILRDVQRDGPTKKNTPRTAAEKIPYDIGGVNFYFREKTKDSVNEKGYPFCEYTNTFSPIRVIELPSSVFSEINKMEETNRYIIDGKKQSFPVTDLDYGLDLLIKYNSNAKRPADYYTIQKVNGVSQPVTDEELESCLLYDLSILPQLDNEALLKELKDNGRRLINEKINMEYINEICPPKEDKAESKSVSIPKATRPKVQVDEAEEDLISEESSEVDGDDKIPY